MVWFFFGECVRGTNATKNAVCVCVCVFWCVKKIYTKRQILQRTRNTNNAHTRYSTQIGFVVVSQSSRVDATVVVAVAGVAAAAFSDAAVAVALFLLLL